MKIFSCGVVFLAESVLSICVYVRKKFEIIFSLLLQYLKNIMFYIIPSLAIIITFMSQSTSDARRSWSIEEQSVLSESYSSADDIYRNML